MTNLRTEIIRIVAEEYERASAIHGKTHKSPHDAHGVIREEYEEAQYEANEFFWHLEQFWDYVKRNQDYGQLLDVMYDHAVSAAAEWAQTAAMCLKAKQREG